MYSLNMLRIAIELAQDDDAYQDIATKFFEHFLMIGGAMDQPRRARAQACGTTPTISSTTG